MKFKLYFISLLSLIISGVVLAQTKVGTTAAPFLTIAVGTRGVSQGGAFAAAANDASALYWNVGAISKIPTNEVYVSQASWIADTKFQYLGIIYHLDLIGTVGFSITNLDYGSMDITTVLFPEGTGEHFEAQDLAIGVSFGRNMTDRFSIGGTVKFISQTIWNESAKGYAIDVGTLYRTGLKGLKLGISICNFGTTMRMSGKDLSFYHDIDPTIYGNNNKIIADLRTDDWNLPLTFRVGAAMSVIETDQLRATVAVDALHPNDNTESLNFGAEVKLFDLISLRGGYKGLGLEYREEGITLGGGIEYALNDNFILGFDYAYQDFGILNNVQNFSFVLGF